MPERIPQSKAIRVPLRLYLSSDHITAATGKTLAVTISKNGASFVNPSAGVTTASETANGWYYVDLSTTDTGTVGPLIVRGTAADCDVSEITYRVLDGSSAEFSGDSDEPVGLEEMKLHCRVDLDDDDTLIEVMITEAREYVEFASGRTIVEATKVMGLDHFPACGSELITLWAPPLQSVTSITYIDIDGAEQTLSTDVYGVDTLRIPGAIYLKPAQSWPSVYAIPNAVTITYVAGYADNGDIPRTLRSAIKLLVAHWYENREGSQERKLAEIPQGVERLIWLNRVVTVV